MVSPAKILVIGLDSADPNLLLKWCDSGELPVLQAFREKGVEGKLTSPPAMGDDAVWASFCTAVSPARHSRYFWKSLQSGSYMTPHFRDEHLKHEPFWNVLSRAGRMDIGPTIAALLNTSLPDTEGKPIAALCG